MYIWSVFVSRFFYDDIMYFYCVIFYLANELTL